MSHHVATITRDKLIEAVEAASPEYVSKEAKHRLTAWAYDAKTFVVGDWDKCPLDQVGLVKKFETRGNYREQENYRFANEASELDAQIIERIHAPGVYGEVVGLEVKVLHSGAYA